MINFYFPIFIFFHLLQRLALLSAAAAATAASLPTAAAREICN